MDLRLIKGTTVLGTKAYYNEGRVYIPAEAHETPVGLWNGETVFFDSPLAGKRICVTVLSPDTFADRLPPTLEHFFALCSAAGAQIIYHDGGVFPSGDLILAIEPGGRHVFVNYMGSAFRSKPLAAGVTTNLKKGLKLAYLPDPVKFNKPQYNLKMSLGAKIFTPAVAIQWPDNQERIGPWLFTSLMEFYGSGSELNGELFAIAKKELEEKEPSPEPLPEVKPEPVQTPDFSYVPVQDQNKTDPTPVSQTTEPRRRKVVDRSRPTVPKHSATMSRTQYPDFFAALELKQKQIPKKKPFS